MQKKSVIVHMGLPKTGSTSIQTFLIKNREQFKELGFYYPIVNEIEKGKGRKAARRVGPHLELTRALIESSAENYETDWRKWLAVFDEFRTSSHLSTLIISSEGMGMSAASLLFGKLYDQIKEFDVRVLVFVRHTETLLTSLFEQRIRGGGRSTRKPDQFAEAIRFKRTGVSGILKAVADGFPGAEITVEPFETIVKTGGPLTYFVGYARMPDSVRLDAEQYREANMPMRGDQTAFLYHCNKFGLNRRKFLVIRKSFMRCNRKYGVAKEARISIFSEQFSRALNAQYKRDVAYIKERFGVDAPAGQPLPRVEGFDPLVLENEQIERLRKEASEFLLKGAKPEFEMVLAKIAEGVREDGDAASAAPSSEAPPAPRAAKRAGQRAGARRNRPARAKPRLNKAEV